MVYGGAGVFLSNALLFLWFACVDLRAAVEGKGIRNPNDSQKPQTYLEHTATCLPETLNQQP